MERAAYRQFADLEESHFWFRGRRSIFFHLLDRFVGPGRDLDVLEVGCGTGGFLRRLARYGRPTGLELSKEFAALSHQQSGSPAICASAYAIPLRDASQDLVCLFDTLEHIPEERRALEEVMRVLRPGGIAFFSVPAYQFLYANNDRVSHHCRRYSWTRLEKSLRASGFTLRKITYFNTFLFPAILPAVLLMKFKERWIGLDNAERTNLSVAVPAPVDEVLYRVMSSERHLLARIAFWCGHSLLAVVQRPAR